MWYFRYPACLYVWVERCFTRGFASDGINEMEEGMLKGGGLATVGVDYYNLGRIAGDMGADILEGKSKPQDMAIRYQTEFKSKINAATAEKLGIKIPDSLAKNAELVRY